jgi:RHS repeat-associated protein
VTKNSVEQARFVYGASGERYQKIAGGVTRTYTYDGPAILREALSTGTTYRYVHGPSIDEPLARRDQVGSTTFYHADHLGSVIKVTDGTGATVMTRRYAPHGELEVGSTEPGYAFTGREWDPEIGLYYYRARYYDPASGRFISEDPIGFRAGTNFYAYVQNDPIAHRDPSGLFGAIGLIAGIIVTGIIIYNLYDWWCQARECKRRADEFCRQYEQPNFQPNKWNGDPVDVNPMKLTKCIAWAHGCCGDQSFERWANQVAPTADTSAELIPVRDCDFTNPPRF